MKNELKVLYRKLLKGLGENKYTEADNDTIVFSALVGNKFEDSRELMIVGRATNGWNVWYNRKKTGSTVDTEIESSIGKLDERLDLTSDIKNWKKGAGKMYNIGGSQFWRVALRVAESIVGTNKDRTDYLLYSNLYKVASDGKNPSKKLKDVTKNDCVEILKAEIEVFKPKRILFLTGYENWAKPFLIDLGVVEFNPEKKSKSVEFIGKYNNIDMVVSVHPQGRGKNETEITDAIRFAFNLPVPERKVKQL